LRLGGFDDEPENTLHEKKEKCMPQSLVQIAVHIIFSTKERRPWLRDTNLRSEMFAVLGNRANESNCPIVAVGGWEDHVHLLCHLGRTTTIANLVRDLKIDSSKWIKTKAKRLDTFRWQEGYGAFAISPSHEKALIAYIDDQAEHHKTVSFQDELRRILKKNGLPIDERYLWD
jgi:REP element-mobilizing transposase RayT